MINPPTNKKPCNVSLVAFYGDKPTELRELIQRLQASLSNHKSILDRFIPYELAQVHGTIIGCEGTKTEAGIVNKWFAERRQETKYIDLAGVTDYLQHRADLPLTIRFGGYQREVDYNFLSRNQSLYVRSFQLQSAGEQTIPVLIGWPWSDDRVTMAIDRLRRGFQQFNLLHKYHGTPEAVDNDFYLRLGTIDAVLNPETKQTISQEICELLANQSPLHMVIDRQNITFARYQDLSLTPATTKTIPIAEITTDLLRQMYL